MSGLAAIVEAAIGPAPAIAVLDAAIKGFALLLIALVIAIVARRRSAAVKHAVWSLAMLGLLVMPIVSLCAPAWQLKVLPETVTRHEPVNARPSSDPAIGTSNLHAAGQIPRDSPLSNQDLPPAAVAPEKSGLPDTSAHSTRSYLLDHWPAITLGLWLGGMAICLIPVLIGNLAIRSLLARATQITSGPWLECFDKLSRRLIIRPVILLETQKVGMPMACGLLVPSLLLPAENEKWPGDRRRVVLEHELAHARRLDCLTQLLARVACSLHWFNPLAWFALRQMRVERERACDDLVIGNGAPPSEYASHLLEIARGFRGGSCLGMAAVAMARPSQLEGRLLAVMDDQRDHRPVSRSFVAAGVLVLLGLVGPLAGVRLAPRQDRLTPQASPAVARSDQPAAPAATVARDDAPTGEKPYTDPGEQFLPADKAPQDAPLRARDSDTFFTLSNARIEHGPRPWPVLVVDYQKTHLGEHAGQALIVRRADGHTETWLLMGPFFDKAGTIRIDLHIRGPFAPGPPKDAELYLTRQEMRYGKWVPTFKVSNSVVLGTMKDSTFARDWTPQEAERLSHPPPDYSNPNAHPTVGRDTAFAGANTGGITSRFVSPDHPLLGIEYRTGEWDKEKCLAQLVPVYGDNQPVSFEPRVIARDGYAVGGANVKVNKFVDAIQLIFLKIKHDGSLDPAQSYTSDWIGAADKGKTIKLGGDGHRILGINCRHAAVLDGLALVTDAKPRRGAN
jgi:beta-lactamase regulating signal transducer with metallopeptidase domain